MLDQRMPIGGWLPLIDNGSIGTVLTITKWLYELSQQALV
jgi:hypothetical protein